MPAPRAAKGVSRYVHAAASASACIALGCYLYKKQEEDLEALVQAAMKRNEEKEREKSKRANKGSNDT
jgi:hypothetical protein